MSNKKSAITIKDLEKGFYNRLTKKKDIVLNKVSFSAYAGDVTIILGQSGCGKSTLFNILIGEEDPDAGYLEILDNDVSKDHRFNLEKVKKRFGILFQYGALFNSMDVGNNIAFPILEHQPQLNPKVVDGMVNIKLNQVELAPEIYKHKMTSTLSGGEKKRVGLARALALDPRLIFYDEPSAGLDPIVSRTIDKLIKDLVRILRISSIVITHELDSAFAIADRMIILKRAVKEHGDTWQGTVVYEEGTPNDLRNSKKPYTVDFLGEYSNHSICLKCRTVQKKDFDTCMKCQQKH